MQKLNSCGGIIDIPTLSVLALNAVEGDSFDKTFTFKYRGTNTTIPIEEGTTGYFKVAVGYHGFTLIMSPLVIDPATNSVLVSVPPQEMNGLGSNYSQKVMYKYAITLTLPSNEVVTYQMGDFVVVSNVIPQVSPQ
ncbi:hypothetical protein NVP1101O_111 [Vibrio phage 1.101.O._10N.261.45.C6]|nr:hypothetical protein NVP1101O_111 [Vibrio phage 1.101.O._10N.261.45.C6]